MVLVDTSVWIEVFRKPARVSLEKLLEFDDRNDPALRRGLDASQKRARP